MPFGLGNCPAALPPLPEATTGSPQASTRVDRSMRHRPGITRRAGTTFALISLGIGELVALDAHGEPAGFQQLQGRSP